MEHYCKIEDYFKIYKIVLQQINSAADKSKFEPAWTLEQIRNPISNLIGSRVHYE